MPSVAVRELREAPDGLIEDILEARAAAAVWRMWSQAEKKTDLPDSPLLQTVSQIDMQLDVERMQGRGGGG